MSEFGEFVIFSRLARDYGVLAGFNHEINVRFSGNQSAISGALALSALSLFDFRFSSGFGQGRAAFQKY